MRQKSFVCLFRPRISFEIGSRFELKRIHKDADRDFAIASGLLARHPDQLAMGLVQSSHGRHQHSFTGRPVYVQPFWKRFSRAAIIAQSHARRDLRNQAGPLVPADATAIRALLIQPDRPAARTGNSSVTELVANRRAWPCRAIHRTKMRARPRDERHNVSSVPEKSARSKDKPRWWPSSRDANPRRGRSGATVPGNAEARAPRPHR